MNKQMKKVGVQLRLCREAKGLTQKALADAAPVGERTLCGIENGYRNCSMAIFNKLLECLEISWSDFFSRVEALPDDFGGDDQSGKKPSDRGGKKVT